MTLSTYPRIRIEPGQNKNSIRVIDLPLEACRVSTFQPRKVFDEGSLQELASSIERHGLLQPITVRRDPKDKNCLIIVAGERRFRAFQLLERETIPAVVTSGNPDEIALIENLQREDLSPLEEAESLRNLQKKYGYTQEELGQAVGKAKATISHLLKLNELPKKIKKEVATSQQASRSLLIEISKVQDPKEQLKLWKEVKERGMTVKQLRRRKKTAEEVTKTSSKRAVTLANQFISELERISGDGNSMDKEMYESLLEVYERFLEFLNEEADRQKQA